ncbi:MAG: hypothetical protein JOY90_31810 [Bradyrhizobium sp.]|nr:hypothetical protein [Bradyrhizobium sp.]
MKLQAFQPSNRQSLQSQMPLDSGKPINLNGLRIVHGRLVRLTIRQALGRRTLDSKVCMFPVVDPQAMRLE